MLANRSLGGADIWAAPAAPVPGILRVLAAVRTACAPTNLLLAAAVVFGWVALIAWTGAGPDSWQARLCANLDGAMPACGAVHAPKDPSRIAPHRAAARIPS